MQKYFIILAAIISFVCLGSSVSALTLKQLQDQTYVNSQDDKVAQTIIKPKNKSFIFSI